MPTQQQDCARGPFSSSPACSVAIQLRNALLPRRVCFCISVFLSAPVFHPVLYFISAFLACFPPFPHLPSHAAPPCRGLVPLGLRHRLAFGSTVLAWVSCHPFPFRQRKTKEKKKETNKKMLISCCSRTYSPHSQPAQRSSRPGLAGVGTGLWGTAGS